MKTETTLIDLALSQPGTAVEQFALRAAAQKNTSAQQEPFRALIPTQTPEDGEQFSFEVDVDRCSACKACVSACHHMNGLSPDESWRRVQQWFGENEHHSWVHTVTSACHHCVNPECMNGCPVGAYEKDSITGIVKHLDDQCIGCEYCIWKCPYEVPKYHEAHGVVRKCDMCSDRLANHEEPACVQACPHDAIRIQTINQERLSHELAHRRFKDNAIYPEAPSSGITQPSTSYLSKRPLNKTHWIAYQAPVSDAKAHWPLIVMLTMTQWGLGMMLSHFIGFDNNSISTLSILNHGIGFLIFMVGIISSSFHLGQPRKAWRFFLGLKKSWLSREILAFSLLASVLLADLSHQIVPWIPSTFYAARAWVVLSLGLGAVFTSVMIYHDTHRSSWLFPRTASRFFGTVLMGTFTANMLLHLGAGKPSRGEILSLGIITCVLGGMKLKFYLSKAPDKIVRSRLNCVFGLGCMGMLITILGSFLKWPETLILMSLLLGIINFFALEFVERYQFFTMSRPPSTARVHGPVMS
jgi:Fe-S-cluster-containing dehydrogenase component/DMSO reductase anchor subunit